MLILAIGSVTHTSITRSLVIENFAYFPLFFKLPTGLNDLTVYMDPEEVQPSNPFLLQKKEDNVLDIALHILETVTARKGPRKNGNVFPRLSCDLSL